MSVRDPISLSGSPCRERLIRQLAVAAEIEHGITCQYLYTAFSLKTHVAEKGVDVPRLERLRHFKAELLGVAREEMAHHGLVLNLLIALGGAPHFRRPPFPHISPYTPPVETHELLPFGETALDRFACYEESHTPSGGDPEVPLKIGDLYQLIRNDLQAVERKNRRLFIGSTDDQITHTELRIMDGQFGFQLTRVHDLPSALAALDSILEHDHFERVTAMSRELRSMVEEDSTFEPARPVVSNPFTLGPGDLSERSFRIENPLTRRAATLFNAAYDLMILLLERIYGGRSRKLEALIRVAFFPLMTSVIRPLGELLTLMPAQDEGGPTAGPTFERSFELPLSPASTAARTFVHERLVNLASECDSLCEDLGGTERSWATPLLARFRLLQENLERLAWNFERSTDLRQTYLQHAFNRFR